MGLGDAVHDGVAPRDKLVEKPGVADVAHDELDPVRGQPGDLLALDKFVLNHEPPSIWIYPCAQQRGSIRCAFASVPHPR